MARFGLIDKANSTKVPLESIHIESKLHGFTAEVTANLVYSNNGNSPIEAVYIFPLDEEAAVCGFQVTINGRTIVAEIQEKQEARDTYDDAISSGQSAFLLEESDETSDIFQISVGNLPPRQNASVKLTFVTTLKVEKEGEIVFVLPTVLNPRYRPSGNLDSITAKTETIASVSNNYVFDFELDVQCASPITEITSPAHRLRVDINPDDIRQANVRLADDYRFDSDVEVHVLCSQPHQPLALVENGVTRSRDGQHDAFLAKPVVMLNFFPQFDSSASLERGEFIFIVDRSGSMDGSKIHSTRQTLLLFLKSLPENCFFNVVGFGSSFQKLFERSERYNDASLQHACSHSEQMKANLGGTEILSPLREVFSQPLIKGYPRQIFLLTDGEVSNTRDVIELVRMNTSKARCFTFGIGEGASTHLVKGVARAGRGTAEFVSSHDRLQSKVMKTLKHALQPAVKDINIAWNLPKQWSVQTVPIICPAVFSGNELVVYGLLDRTGGPSNQIVAIEGTVTLSGTIDNGNGSSHLQHVIKFSAVCGNRAETNLLLHRLCAKVSIQEQNDKARIIQLSKSANVVSKLTSFVAVDKDSHVPVSRAIEPSARQAMQFGGRMFGFCGSLPMGMRITGGGGGPPPCAAMAMNRFVSQTIQGPPPPPPPSGDAMVFNQSLPQSLPRMAAMAPIQPPPPPRSHSSKMAGRKIIQQNSPVLPHKGYQEKHLPLISLQSASGAWHLTDRLASICGIDLEKLQQVCPSQLAGPNRASLWATALAIVWLERICSKERDEWEIVASKGIKWLKVNLARNGMSFDDVMYFASRILAMNENH